MKNIKIDMTLCVMCGASIAALYKCHACDYVQDDIYDDYDLQLDDYHLALEFYPHMMKYNFREFALLSQGIREQLVTYTGRQKLHALRRENEREADKLYQERNVLSGR